MLTPRQARFAFIPLAAGIMSGVISLVLTTLHVGLVPDLLSTWLRTWPLSFAVALPTAWVVLPTVQALLAKLTHTATIPSAGRHSGRLG